MIGRLRCRRPRGASLVVAMLLLAAGSAFDAGTVTRAQTPPNFRAAVDVIPVDVQVVDPTGRPSRGSRPTSSR